MTPSKKGKEATNERGIERYFIRKGEKAGEGIERRYVLGAFLDCLLHLKRRRETNVALE